MIDASAFKSEAGMVSFSCFDGCLVYPSGNRCGALFVTVQAVQTGDHAFVC